MQPIHPTLQWTLLTPQEGIFLFGYYDRLALNPESTKHLALKVPQEERLPRAGETAEIGVVDVASNVFQPLVTTEAWCHQQGSMTQWLVNEPDCFIYNDFDRQADGSWKAVARVFDLSAGKVIRTLPRPSYVLSHHGKYAASLNFSRIPRRGYSYARAEIASEPPVPDMDNDGLFLMDVATGESKLIAPYRKLIEAHPCGFCLSGKHIWLNHAIFNCDDSRVMVLLRHCPEENLNAMWKTYMITMDLDGGNMLCPLPDLYWRNGGISHQMWGRTPREILVDANWCDNGHEYVVFDEDRVPMSCTRVSAGMGPMGHLIFSPDGKWMAADTYSQADGYQTLSLVNVATGTLTEIGRFRHGDKDVVDTRCDLHPRWSADGRYLTVDTIHYDDRKICMFDATQVTG